MKIAGTLSKYWFKNLKLKAPQCKQMQIDQNLKPTRPSLADGFATFVPATMTKAIFGKMGQYLCWDC